MPRLSVDSNVLIYTVDRQDWRHARAVEIMARAVRADCVLSLQSVAEFYHVVTRKRITAADAAESQVDDMLARFPGTIYDATTMRDAIVATRRHAIPFWDAMLWATIKAAGCRFLLTEDLQDGRDLEGVRFVNPFDPANDAVIELILPGPPARP